MTVKVVAGKELTYQPYQQLLMPSCFCWPDTDHFCSVLREVDRWVSQARAPVHGSCSFSLKCVKYDEVSAGLRAPQSAHASPCAPASIVFLTLADRDGQMAAQWEQRRQIDLKLHRSITKNALSCCAVVKLWPYWQPAGGFIPPHGDLAVSSSLRKK